MVMSKAGVEPRALVLVGTLSEALAGLAQVLPHLAAGGHLAAMRGCGSCCCCRTPRVAVGAGGGGVVS